MKYLTGFQSLVEYTYDLDNYNPVVKLQNITTSEIDYFIPIDNSGVLGFEISQSEDALNGRVNLSGSGVYSYKLYLQPKNLDQIDISKLIEVNDGFIYLDECGQ
jgi:hypothetical protein